MFLEICPFRPSFQMSWHVVVCSVLGGRGVSFFLLNHFFKIVTQVFVVSLSGFGIRIIVAS